MKQYLITLILFCFLFQITDLQAQQTITPDLQEAVEACITLNDSSTTYPVEIKVVFIVDKGSHNYISTDLAPEGNDRFALTRTYHVRQLFEDYKENECFSWSMITFRGEAGGRRGIATASIFDDTAIDPVFTRDHSIVNQAINNLYYTTDNHSNAGKIQYGEALQLTRRLIRDDLEQTDNTYYFVFFITGAAPSDRFFPTYYPLDEYLYRDIENIVNIKPERTFFSTAYYGTNHLTEYTYDSYGSEGPNIPNVITILQNMANIGKGQFFNLTEGETLDL